MKYTKAISILLVSVSMLMAGAELEDFSGYADESRIVIQWNTAGEDNLLGFDIQRSTDGQTFLDIGFLEAQGSQSGYTFIDDSIIAKVSGRPYQYRLKIRNLDGSNDYSHVITIESVISDIKHTWGSLKALFK